MFEYFDHTADVGIRVRAADLAELLADAGRALFGLIVENLDDVRDAEVIDVRVAGAVGDDLLFDWLSELLHTFETTGLVLCRFDVDLSNDGIRARAWGEPIDPDRHRLGHEVKAVTYHMLKLEQTGDEWLGEAVVDL
ncbi:MAG: archease [Planctomycetota bacterium]|nr:MAG: archease [Planctomycetota bacterium]REJ96061.1 MAG: archease [Planctomycetota bacterium]REK31075.1 MAG: archease [Planctomycetota bacterium]REK36811.1 MAG: archease [Planctomycetota bacterium]